MKQVSTGPGLLVGIPTLGRLQPIQWGLAFKAIGPPINFNTTTTIIWGEQVAIARQKLAEQALELNTKYLFFIGDDVVPPAHTLKQLIYRLEQNKDIGIVGGVYCSKVEPSAPLVFRGNGQGSYWDWKIGEFFEITGLGMDCTLIRTDVFKKLSKPFFKTVDTDKYFDGISKAESWTEDLWFCEKVLKETQYKIFCDASVICDHYEGNRVYNLPIGSLPTRKVSLDGLKSALDIGCGAINRANEFPDHKLIRVDINDDWEPDYRCDVRQLPFAENSYDLVFSSHVLEHFRRSEYEKVLEEWLRVLKPGGTFMLVLPNLLWSIKKLNESVNSPNEADLNDILNVFYGAQTSDYDFHYNGFWPERLRSILESFKLKDITMEEKGFNMMFRAIKP